MHILEDGDRPLAWRRRRDQRRPEILAAARQEIEEGQYDGRFIARVALRAGVSEATVYKYFENKQELINQVISLWLSTNIERLQAEILAAKDAEGKLLLIAMRHLYSIGERPGIHKLIYTVLRWSGYRGSPLHRLNQRYARIVQSAFKEGVANCEFRSDIDIYISRDLFFGGLEHIGWRIFYDKQPVDIQDAAERLVTQIVGGMRVPSAQSDAVEIAVLIDRLDALTTSLKR